MIVRRFHRLLILMLVTLLVLPTSIHAQEPSALTEHYSTTTTIGDFSFDYPEGWVLDDDLEPGAVWMSSNAAMLASNDYLPDEVVVAVVFPDSLDVLGLDIAAENLSADTIVNAFATTTAMADHLGPIQRGDVGEHQAVWLDLLVENEEGMVLAVALGDYVSVIIAASLPDEFEAFRSTVFEIVASITLEASIETENDNNGIGDEVVFEGQYTNSESGIGFQFPDAWLIQVDQVPGVTFLASSAVILDRGDPVPGGALLIILTEAAFAETFGDQLGTNATEIVQNTVEAFLLPVVEGAPTKVFMVGEHDAARTSFMSDTAEGVVMAIDLGDRYGIIIAATSIGEFADFETTILSIAETIRIGQEIIELPESYSSADFAYIFDYPAGWTLDDSTAPITVVVSNVNNAASTELGAGEALVFVYDPIAAGFSNELTLRQMTDAWQALILEDGDAQVGDIEEIKVGTYDATRLNVVNDVSDGVVLVIEVTEGDYAVVVATTAPGEFAEFEGIVLAIAASVQSAQVP